MPTYMEVMQMSYVPRLLDLISLLSQKSYFLFGPRQTGKSSLIRHELKNIKVYNLLESETYLKLSRAPQRLREECGAQTKLIVIDEIQKLPTLLDEVQLLIEERGIKFLLTGSSARKLRRSGVNLLGGRARTEYLFPLSYRELKEKFHLKKAINNGLLPSIYFSDNPDEDLHSYVGTYLKEEIAAEGLTRNIPAFSRFLEVAALCNGRLINYTNIANDAQVARATVQQYFQILKDTLIADELPAWQKSHKRKAIGASKFYFFDTGVVRFLQNRKIIADGSPEFGELFETYMFNEIKVCTAYKRLKPMAYWRSASGHEVDFIIDDRMAVEAKASSNISPNDLKGLKALREENKFKEYVVVCMEKKSREVDGIRILPWQELLDQLWG